ncbi:long-chain fatty acid--CoA ligase [Aeromicrobium phragmitis]|uniref:Long-chain fatty acid--CoA ligase n=1 Tax=Aeromicrobium phragmitis TaxID=2478914 RepID=A0A3L8PJW5_9ACTN|nr:AMP-binding protein [Aeromicrobium phragmitis]RLV55591.1 long-chain fatty acid--CoA ligase [Aeromicrobium phragmitis]
MSESFVSCGSTQRSLAAVKDRAARFATGLRERGVARGDRFAIYMRNEISFLELNLAAGLIGAVPVPINWHWTGSDLAHVLRNSEVSLVVAHTDLLPPLRAQAPEKLMIVEAEVPAEVREAYRLGEQPLTGEFPVLSDWERCDPWNEAAPPAPMSVIYTSGTTGQAKGVLRDPIAPEVLPTTLGNVADLYHLRPGETTLIPAPLYHSAPNVYSNFAAALGMTIIIMPRFDAERFLELVSRHQVDTVHAVPTMFSRLLQLPQAVREGYDVSSLHSVVHAGAPCPPAVKTAMIEWLGPIVHEYYGGSEIGAWTACDSFEALERPGTVGRPILDADIRILDGQGAQLPAGADGVVYGKTFSGWPDFTYIGDDEKRRRMEVDGYLTLGDIGHLDEDGYLYLSDRMNDMVVSGGVNIYPAEIEACLLDLDGVVDSAVFGIPDSDLGEALAAHVQVAPDRRLDAAAVRDHVRGRLAGYKVPREVVLVDDLPREDTGKLFKRKLKAPYWAATEVSS